MMKTIILRPAEPERDFGQLAAVIASLEDDPTIETGFNAYYEERRQQLIHRVAEDEHGELLGFYWAIRSKLEAARIYFNLFVRPEQRGQGVGRRLYEDLARAVEAEQAKRLQVKVWDNCPEGMSFAERRGFTERLHFFAMEMNLADFDDRPYAEIIARLKGKGFQFTSMGELGNTEEAQRQLYVLNDTTGMEVPDTDGGHTWESFEDFQKAVCQSDWYKPDGQMVVIDTVTGTWAAMSAITRWGAADYAYNLHTGVDKRYRGRKLGQAVKVLALRYAREILKANTVRTHHNTKNLPIIAIDHKLGYARLPGTFVMQKILE
jgi:GNAT superfamily N-acetyltransferase